MDERKRAKHKALYLLERMDRTEQELRQKLARDYGPDIVEEALAYVKEYHYIDDMRYAKNYIAWKSQTKGRRLIEQELVLKKGVARDIVCQAFEESETEDERFLIRRWMEKKKFHPETSAREEQQKFYLFLMRKGFNSRDIRRELLKGSDEDWDK